MLTTTSSGSPALSLAGRPEPGRAWETRLVANRRGLPADAAAHLHAAAAKLEAPGTRVDEVVYTAHREPAGEQVRIVRHPSLSEAASADRDWVLPLTFLSYELEQASFPMTVIAAPAAFYNRYEVGL